MPAPPRLGAVSAVVVQGLVKRYGQLTAVDGLSFTARPGEITALLGPNGAGKTTTVEICEGLRRADAGTVQVLGLPPGARELRPAVGVMPQRPGAYPGARCGEMLHLVAAFHAAPLDPDRLLSDLGLAAAARTAVRRLSGGQQQRLSLAMALIGRPRVLFLDEPSAGLDVQARHAVWDLLRGLREEGVAVLLTTHDMQEAAELADQVVVVDRGRVLAAGSVPELTGTAGGGRVRFAARAGLDVAPLLAGTPAGTQVTEAPPGSYLVTGPLTPETLSAVLAWGAGQGAQVQQLQLAGRTLEDVFLELTGRGLRG